MGAIDAMKARKLFVDEAIAFLAPLGGHALEFVQVRAAAPDP